MDAAALVITSRKGIPMAKALSEAVHMEAPNKAESSRITLPPTAPAHFPRAKGLHYKWSQATIG